MKFTYRLILNIFELVVTIGLQLIGACVLLPTLVFYDIGQLPQVLRWFDSADPYVNRDTSTIQGVNAQGYWAKYTWLAWRNPINYFGYKVLGFQFKGNETYDIEGPVNVGNRTGEIEGYRHIELNTGYYEYLYIKKVGNTNCIYLRMGYKISNTDNPSGSYCQQVFDVSYQSYTGE